jgi:hypothetical protein
MPIRDAAFRPARSPQGLAEVSGNAAPHAQIEIENATVRADRTATTPATIVADANGDFTVPLRLAEGDFVRLRAHGTGGPSSWLTVRATGLAPTDTRNAPIDPFALSVVPRADGTLAIDGRGGAPLSEPFARMRYSNPANGFFVDVTLDENGCIPNAPLVLNGALGDHISVAISDGVANVDFAMSAMSVVVTDTAPTMKPPPLARDGQISVTRFTGPLFVDGPTPTDVQQGQIGNCYFPAAMAALAHACPDAIESMIRTNDDGTFTVRFFDTSWVPVPKQVLVTVNAELYTRGGQPAYGRSLSTPNRADEMELWFPLLEKAYAAFRGSYEIVGQGGAGGKVMSNVLGTYDDYTDITRTSADVVWSKLKSAVDAGHPTTAGTHGQAEAHRFPNTGLYANHAYSLLGAREEQGQRFVTLRNPWGSSEAGNDGKNDGIFELDFEIFQKLFVNIASVPVV